MGIRFRKRIKILPGVHINLSRSGISTSLGVRGASITKGHGQTRTNLGIPGSGLSHNTVVVDQINPPTGPGTGTKVMNFIGSFLVGALAWSAAADARSAAERRAFQRSNPCPSTGKTAGSCPGYVVDHIVPLCAGGSDSPANMQWQELAESRAKDKQEWRQCRELRATRS